MDFACSKELRLGQNKNFSRLEEEEECQDLPKIDSKLLDGRIIVVGAGPAGLFAALELAKSGGRPLIIERGSAMNERVAEVERFRSERILNPETNMLFGEGGAGTFSDGKLTTGIKDGNIRRVLRELRDAGAQEEIMYMARPHIGTDMLRRVIVNLRKRIESLGGEFRFDTRLEEFLIEDSRLIGIKTSSVKASRKSVSESKSSEEYKEEVKTIYEKNAQREASTETLERAETSEVIKAEALVLAIGHSARDTFKMIKDAGLNMQQKAFSIGVRMEHPQSLIDAAQYGEENVGKLPPADYKISYKASNGRGVYSFCMCPGGEVVVCSTKDGELCVNGMSNSKRDSGVANTGILCDVRTSDFGDDDVLAGVRFQEKYERLAFINGGGNFKPPKCSVQSFMNVSKDLEARAVLDSLPSFAAVAIREAVPVFAGKIKGYDSPGARVIAVETRSSSPVRILRDEDGQSNIIGIYPAGEGAGYAGGITSAACDGIRAASHIIDKYR
ncbi:MAG: FAD-dependent oxidoreductase [Mogibacterium sp.]|nr:FAD-dependent oxidoreductase [Mogibacterium sp.]